MSEQRSECPLVSVIIPTYNNETRIARTLESIIAQDYPNIEIVVVNDVSTDNTSGVAHRVLAKYGRPFQIIERETNGGQSTSRNTGLDAAHGDYVIFFDHDDLAEKNYVSRLCAEAERKNTDIVFCGYRDRYEESGSEVEHPNVLGHLPVKKYIKAWLIGRKYCCGAWCCIFRKRFLDRTGLRFHDGCRWSEDIELIAKALMTTNRVSCIPDALYIWVHHSTQQSQTNPPERQIQDWFSRLRVKRYMMKQKVDKGTRSYVTGLFLAVAFVKKFTVYARAGDREGYDRQLRALHHRKARELLLSTAKFAFIEPEVFLKSLALLYFPNLYYRLRAKVIPAQPQKTTS